MNLLARACLLLLLPLLAGSSMLRAADADDLPENLGHGLRNLVAWHQAQQGSASAPGTRSFLATAPKPFSTRRVQTDEGATTAIVNVRLDGTLPLPTVKASLEALGLTIFAQYESTGPRSVLSAHLPLDQAAAAARTPGVLSIMLAHKPWRRAGNTTTQGAAILHTPQVNAQGYSGSGITVGVLSDSYNLTVPSAQNDVLSDDLPGIGNPAGHTRPVYVLAEGSHASGNDTDEGRAMLQIVHDLAPDATLAFATAGDTDIEFAQNIRALRTDPQAHCNVLVDDIAFADEPFFSDGVISQAVDAVVHSTALKGTPVLYYSAVGNDGNQGYLADYIPLPVATALTSGTNVKLNQVPTVDLGDSLHNFNPAAARPAISQSVTVTGDAGDSCEIAFQWDDPYPGKQTTAYNLLVFDASGNYLPNVSGVDNTFLTGAPEQVVDLPVDNPNGTVYQLVITRRHEGSESAVHLRYVADIETGAFSGQYIDYYTPTAYGHVGAPGADGVAAYDYTDLTAPETYTSLGPVTIYFDDEGNRLPQPEVRQQPTMAGIDGVDVTITLDGSLTDTDGDGYPNFYGTSAAAPHAAGVAALILEAAGGPGRLNDVQMRTLLEETANPHDLTPFSSAANVTTSGRPATVTLTAEGNSSNAAATDPKFFHLAFSGPAKSRLDRVTIDLSAAQLVFDPTVATGLPFTVTKPEGVTARDITASVKDGVYRDSKLELLFAPGTFAPGDSFSFGIDRDEAATNAGGNQADLLQSATVNIVTSIGTARYMGAGTFKDDFGSGYCPVDGYGILNAEAALVKLQTGGAPPAAERDPHGPAQ